ncbi:MAG TPA: hypothetical protein VN081_04250 [Dongiaceae bacterium]|nr:hypothetical protein [Dongiaceae bacterium]
MPQRVYLADIEPGRTFEALATNGYMLRRDQALSFEVSVKTIDRQKTNDDLARLSLTLVVLSESHTLTNYTRTAIIERDRDPEAPYGSAVWHVNGKPIVMQTQGTLPSGFMVFDDPNTELDRLIAVESRSLQDMLHL